MFKKRKKSTAFRTADNRRFGASFAPPSSVFFSQAASCLPVQCMIDPDFSKVLVTKPDFGKTASVFFLKDAKGDRYVLKIDAVNPKSAYRETFASNFIHSVGMTEVTAPESRVVLKDGREAAALKKALATDVSDAGRELFRLLYSSPVEQMLLQEFSQGSHLEFNREEKSNFWQFWSASSSQLKLGRLAAMDLMLGNWDRIWTTFNEGNLLIEQKDDEHTRKHTLVGIDQFFSFSDLEAILCSLKRGAALYGPRKCSYVEGGKSQSFFDLPEDRQPSDLLGRAQSVSEDFIALLFDMVVRFMQGAPGKSPVLERLEMALMGNFHVNSDALLIGFLEGCMEIAKWNEVHAWEFSEANDFEAIRIESGALMNNWRLLSEALNVGVRDELAAKLTSEKTRLGLVEKIGFKEKLVRKFFK